MATDLTERLESSRARLRVELCGAALRMPRRRSHRARSTSRAPVSCCAAAARERHRCTWYSRRIVLGSGPVATSTRRKTTSTTRRSGSGNRSRSGAAKGKRPAASKQTEPMLRRAMRQTTDGHGADAWGLVMIALGVLLAMGTYLGWAGAAGRALSGGVGGAVGLLRYLVPPAIILVGVAFVTRPPGHHRDPGRSHHRRSDPPPALGLWPAPPARRPAALERPGRPSRGGRVHRRRPGHPARGADGRTRVRRWS